MLSPLPARGFPGELSSTRPLRPEGERALARLVGDIRQPARHGGGARMHGGRVRPRRELLRQRRVYAAGKSEEIMGEALKKLAWPRLKYIVSTKFFWGITEGTNEKSTLNRKYLM